MEFSAILALCALAGPTGQGLHPGLKTRTPILTYHDVITQRGPGSVWFDVTVEEFRAQLDWLQAHGAKFVTLDQVYRHLALGRPLPPKAIAVTFADNYLGFYRYALPILRARRIPTAMFVHTKYVGATQGRPKMRWPQLEELDREGLVTIASQTATHPEDMTRLSIEDLRWELSESKQALETHLRHPIPYLAYPNGKWDARVAAEAKRAGYTMAFSEVTQPAERSKSRWSVNRYVHTKMRQAWRDAYGG